MASVEHSKRGAWLRRPSVWLSAGVAVVLGCFLLLPHVLHPAVDVNNFCPKKGMSMDEVRAQYGPPSEEHPGKYGMPNWYYSTDRFGLGFFSVGVEFDETGRVTGYWND
jgi:hypothetical protein